MRSWAARAALAALAGAAVIGAALAQDAPKSILPPGFDQPAPAPKPAPPKPVEAKPADAKPVAKPASEAIGPAAAAPASPAPKPPLGATPAAEAAALPALALDAPVPANAVGLLSAAQGGYGPATFAGSNGRFLAVLMRRLDVPLASRWAHIVLRRALLSQVPAPPGLRPADWVAERAALLTRMGEADGAKALVEGVPVDRFTLRMYSVAADADLAAADLPALCPLAPTARTLGHAPFWTLIDAMCAALDGDDLTAAALFDELRGGRKVSPFDVKLAERIAAAAGGGGRATNVEWQTVARLTPYRFGLGVAGGAIPPAELLVKSPPAMRAWLMRAPAAPLATRLAMAPTAVALGVSSSDEMVRLYSAYAADLDAFELQASPAGTLRTAFAGNGAAARLAAMRTLWARGGDPGARYAMRILTARAAATIRPDAALADAAPELAASMLSAGLIAPAARWWPVADAAGGDVRARTWALLVLADTDGRLPPTARAFGAWQKGESARLGEAAGKRRAQLMAAALLGLGRGGADWEARLAKLDVPPLDNIWTRKLDAAAAAGRPGEVALLAATGLQTGWRGVPPRHLAHILAAYCRVGLAHEAHMLAVEALTRG